MIDEQHSRRIFAVAGRGGFQQPASSEGGADDCRNNKAVVMRSFEGALDKGNVG